MSICNVIGDWYIVGDTYVGTAPIVGYSGGNGTGSFVTDNWTADRKTYTPVPGYSYTVNSGTSIKDITRAVDQNAINTFQRLLNEAKQIIEDLTYAGTGITYVEDAYEAAIRHYTLDSNGNPIANQGTTRAQLIPLMIDLDYAITEARKAMDSLQ